jgi:hypothetical protein
MALTFPKVLELLRENCLDIFGICREDNPDILKDMELASIRGEPFHIRTSMLEEIFPELHSLVPNDRKSGMNRKVKAYVVVVSCVLVLPVKDTDQRKTWL